MKLLIGKKKKVLTVGEKVPVVVSVDLRGIPVFKGFSYTVAEGQRLSRTSFTEAPEFVRDARAR